MTAQTEAKGQFFVLGPFVYDIDKALRIIAAGTPRMVTSIPVADWARSLGVDKTMDEHRASGRIPLLRGEVDEEYARTRADLSIPVIVGDLRLKDDDDDPMYMLLDGTHRLRRAFLEGHEHLDAYLLTQKETKRIRSTSHYGPGRTRR